MEACESINFADTKKSLAWLTSALKTRTTAVDIVRCFELCIKGSREKSKDIQILLAFGEEPFKGLNSCFVFCFDCSNINFYSTVW